MTPSEDILSAAFGARSWRGSVDALFEATGLVVSVTDAECRALVHSTSTCSHCELFSSGAQTPGDTCFDAVPELPSGRTTRMLCRGGLPCYATPVEVADERYGTVFVGGFVSSTRDRKRLFEKLLGSGVDEGEARLATRDVPILTQREVEALARMVSVNAHEAVRHAIETGGWARRLGEIEVFAEAGREFMELGDTAADVNDAVLSRAMQVAGADSGSIMLLRPNTDVLEVVAAAGDSSDTLLGSRTRVGEGVAGRVARTRRSVLVSGGDGGDPTLVPGHSVSTAISVPLVADGDLLGVLNVTVSGPRRLGGEQMLMLERFSEMASVTLRNARQSSDTKRRMYEHMHLGAYSKSLGSVSSIDEVEHTTASVLGKAFDFDLAGLAVTGWARDDVIIVVEGEVPADAVDDVVGEACGRDVVGEPFDEVTHVTTSGVVMPAAGAPADWTTMSVEVMVRDTLVGYVFISSAESGTFDGDDRRLLIGLADYAAAALEKAALYARLRDDYAKTIAALAAALDVGERRDVGHSDRVMDYAMSIGEEMNLSRDDLEVLRFAGLLHDVGKLGVAEEILLKPSRLTRIEMEKVRRHAEFGASIVEQIEFLDSLAPVIMHHHERWDGDGYPAGLAGEEIPILARILHVADAFDAMTSERPYQQTLSLAEARRELRAQAGSQFDPRVATAFLNVLESQARAGATGLLADSSQPEEQLPS